MVKRFILGFAALVAACSQTPETVVEYQRVEVPVPVYLEPPTWLATPYRPPQLPVFVGACEIGATSALKPEGEKNLRLMVHDLITREKAWRAWAARYVPP